MNTLSSIITTLSPEEKKNFISLLKKKNKRTDTKNLQLFKLLDTQPDQKDLDIILYSKRAKGAFHALCKRLYDSLIDFIASKNFEGETSEEMETMKLLLVSRIFFEQKQFKIATKTIKKAEQKAKKYDLYSILREIYYTRIQYAHLDNQISFEAIREDFRNNQKILHLEENLNLFYAAIQDQLIRNPNNLQQTIEESLSKFDISSNQDLSFRSLYKLLEIINQSAHVSRNFYMILPFVQKTYQQIEIKQGLTEKHLFYHIQVLYYVANSYFRNKEFETSLKYLGIMKGQMTKQREKYRNRFLAQYTLLYVLNLNYSGHSDQAILLLENFEYSKFKNQTSYLLDLRLTRIVFYFQQSRNKEALRLYIDLHHSDTWYSEKAGIIWVIKKNLTEILLHIELNNDELVSSKTNSFRKKHGQYLKNNNDWLVLDFLSLATKYYYDQHILEKELFLKKIENVLIKKPSDKEDIFVMSFYAWLQAKVTGTNLYKTTLEIINQSPSLGQ